MKFRLKEKGFFFIISVCCLLVVVMTSMQGCSGKEDEQDAGMAKDLTKHPIYAKYEFDNAEHIINMGIQPLWFPTALITEAVKRDVVLRNALSELGMIIRFFSFLKGDDANFFMKRQDIEVCVAGDMPTISAASKIDIVIPILIHQGFISIITNRYMLLNELRGKPIGYAYGASAHYALLNALASEEINENQVKLIPMDITDMPLALQKGKISAFTSWEPNTTIMLKKYRNNVVIRRSQFSGYMYFLKTFSDKHPEATKQIMAAKIRAVRWMFSDRRHLFQASRWALAAAEKLSGKKPALSVEECADVARKDISNIFYGPIIPEKYIQPEGPLHKEFEFLKSLGKIPASVQWKRIGGFFKTEITKEIMVQQEKYRLNEFKYKESQDDI